MTSRKTTDRDRTGPAPARWQCRGSVWIPSAVVLVMLIAVADPAQAYIGPGAGFALGGSFLFAIIGFFVSLGSLLLWPLRAVRRWFRGRRRRRRGIRARRVIVLGLDGLDPGLARRFMRRGEMPHLARLHRTGGFRPLRTTWPAMSPVGWSTFATGVDASGHNIFDFLSRDPGTHLPVLSSTRISRRETPRRLGGLLPRRVKERIELLRRSKPFWKTAAEHGVETSILRVPITFPPDRYTGRLLSAMCVPDLRGTQGTFSHYTAPTKNGDGTTRPDGSAEMTGGVRLTLEADGGPDAWRGRLVGPDQANGSGSMTHPFSVRVDHAACRAEFRAGGEAFTLGPEEDSPWIRVTFGRGRRRARGICKFRVTSFARPFACYVTPLHIDPESPAMPIANPPHLAIALAKLHGSYATLGLAEDTWALNTRVIDEQAFLDQAWSIFAERRRQFFHALDRQRDGVVAVVVDTTDRIQHMFFRTLDAGHPANRDKETDRWHGVIPDLYRRADALVGETVERLGKDDVLLVASDHGFKPFRRCVNLNTWFRENGYLSLVTDPVAGPPPPLPVGSAIEPADIDWSRTRAYTNGLAGFYVNVAGRERDGSVDPADAPRLKGEIMDRLRGLRDEDRGEIAISELWDCAAFFRGPYRENGPDVIVGYRPGYRADWDGALGRVTASAFTDNERSWSGDHCMDPRQVPGVLFSSRPFTATRPGLEDLAPSILDLLGIEPPHHMTGRSLFQES